MPLARSYPPESGVHFSNGLHSTWCSFFPPLFLVFIFVRFSNFFFFFFGKNKIDVDWKEFYHIMFDQFVQLEKGFEVSLGSEKMNITGGIAVATSDLPQGNDKAGIKRQNAQFGCRGCLEPKSEIYLVDSKPLLRTSHKIIATRKEILEQEAQREQAQLEQSTGVLKETSPFEKLSFDLGVFFFFFFFVP